MLWGSDFEHYPKYLTGLNQYTLRLPCIHERPFNYLKHVKEDSFTLNLAQAPKVSSLNYAGPRPQSSLTDCAPTNHCSGPVASPLGTVLMVWKYFTKYKGHVNALG